jgi:hypothetical protein
MKKDNHNFVTECEAYQRNKGEIVKTPRPLQPLPILTTILSDLSMDFIVGLPKVATNQPSWW